MLALAAGGSSGDPLVSLSHLTGTFTDTNSQVDQKAERIGSAALEQLSAESLLRLRFPLGQKHGSSRAMCWLEPLEPAFCLADSANVTFASGAVIDVTTGTAISSGTALAANHRYMVAEDTTAQFAVTSKTAVLDYQGILFLYLFHY